MKRITKTILPILAAGVLALPGVCTSVRGASSAALDMARQLNQAFIEVSDQVSPAVVVITVTQKSGARDVFMGEDSVWDMLPPEWRKHFDRNNTRPQRHKAVGQGSGIVITEDGYILTNNHVVDNAEKIKVRFKDGRTFDAEVKGTDPESDVAVIKINAKKLQVAKLGDSDKTRVGEFVIAIGAPFDLDYSVTVGHVSSKGRSFPGMSEGYTDQDFIQTDASINPGNSGGPLVNLYGEVIGINAMIRGLNTGIGFAIPINLASRVKDHLIAEGKFTRSWIGVLIRDIKDAQEVKGLDTGLAPDVEEGVLVYQIEAGGPASKSTLKPFDVMVAVDGKKVRTPRDLQTEISTKPVGQTVTLDVVRGKSHVSVKIKTEAVPVENGLASAKRGDSQPEVESNTYGLTVQPLTKDMAAEYNVEKTPGVIVTGVEPNSPAATQGIKPGDVITEINRKPVTSTGEFSKALKDSNPRNGMIVNLISNGASKFVVLKEGE